MGQCFTAFLWPFRPLRCFDSSLDHDSGDEDQTASPRSSSTLQDYEVFLSFRGEDTRCGFTDHLYHVLVGKGIRVFRDDERLQVGEKIDKLLEAIKASKILVPIISTDYASSMWCLRELLQIIECNKTSGQLVLPIFYKVKPSDARELKGEFGKKFRSCRKKNDLDGKFVQDLQNAFEQVTSMKGWESDKIANGHEGALVKIVVRRIFNESRKPILSLPDLLVGVGQHIEAIKEKFDGVPSNDAKIIVIHGMGGIGKTTLAKALYNEFFESFECQSFVANIREASSKDKGIEGLQNQMISRILGDNSLQEISYVDEGKTIIENSFKGKRLLLVLDDVENEDQLDKLAAKKNWFGPTSIVIITTRNKNVIRAPGVNLDHELNELNYDQSYKLFCKHAFRRDATCPEDLETIARDIVSMTGGLPLAIEVIGSLLHGKVKSVWRDTKEKLRRMQNSTVHEKLKISYDALDYAQRQIFLDIACLMPIRAHTEVGFEFFTYMWKACDFYPDEGINALVSVSLIKVLDGNHVVMHDQLKDLGREIVRNEGCNEIGKRSRIWLEDEATELIEGKQRTGNIQAIVLDRKRCKAEQFEAMDNLRFPHLRGRDALVLDQNRCKAEQFEGMDNLRFLHLVEEDLTGDFENLIPNLRWFHWSGSPLRHGDIMRINFNPKKLVILHLEWVNITEYWKGWRQMKDLKALTITFCDELTAIPDLSAVTGLEYLRLHYCRGVNEIHPSIGRFSKTLKTLIFEGCRALEELPLEVGKMEELRELNISRSGIKEIPISDGYMRKLETLDASECNQLTSIPDSIGDLSNLKKLLIRCTSIKCFPTSFGKLSKLVELDLQGCQELESLSNLPCNLSSLEFHGDSMETLTDISKLTILKDLTYWDLFERRNKVLNVGKLNQLESLEIQHSNPAKEMDMAPDNFTLQLELPSSLVNLRVCRCQTLRTLPSLSNLKNLWWLYLKDCSELMEINNLEGAESLRTLNIEGCGKLSRLGDVSNMKNLSSLHLKDCSELMEINILEGAESLRTLNIEGCGKLSRLGDVSNLKNLSWIGLKDCSELMETNILEGAESLTHLYIQGCGKLSRLGNISNLKMLRVLRLNGCGKLSDVEGMEKLTSLTELHICGCNPNINIPDLSMLRNLEWLTIIDAELMEIPWLQELESLKWLTISSKSLQYLPDLSHLTELWSLDISGCEKLREIRGIGNMESLNFFVKEGRTALMKSPGLMMPRNLEYLKITDAELKEIPWLQELKSLKDLTISSKSLQCLPDLSHLTELSRLDISGSEKLLEIQGIENMKSLRSLSIKGCTALRKLPDLPDVDIHSDGST